MKQKNLLTRMLLLFALIVGSTSAWADTTDELLSENFSSITTGNSTSTSGSGTAWSGNDNFPTVSTAYQAGGAVRLGGKSSTGSITSKSLTVNAGNLTVAFDVKGWSSVEGSIKVTVGSQNQTVTYTSTMSGSFESKSVDFTIAESSSMTVKLETTAKRAFLDNIVITNTYSSGPTTYSVTYDGNGNTSGTVPTDDNAYEENDEVTVLGNTGNLAMPGYTFGGWNTQDDGLGTNYSAGNTFTITANTTLYAKWNAKAITGLSYTGTPTTTEYNSGESFDPTGLTVTATFDDNSSEDVTSLVVWTPDPLTTGTTAVTGTYMEQTINVSGLTVTAAPGSTPETAYTVAEAIAATPSSGTSANVYIKGVVSKFFGSSTNILGDGVNYRYYISDDGTTTNTNQLLVYNGKGLNNVAFSSADDLLIGDEVVIYGGLTTYNSTKEVAKDNYIVSLTRKELSSIALSGTYTTEFVEGATFNHDGVVVTATYSDNSTEDVTALATFSEPDMNTVGEQTVTVTYQDKTATYDITITAAPTYTATFSVNGTTTTADFKENASVTFPAVADVAGMKFMGWTGAAIVGTQATAPATLITTDVMGNADKTYYAVFAVETVDATPSLTKLGSDATFSANDNIVVVANCDATHIYAMYQDNASTSDYVENYEFVNNAATINSDNKNYWTLTSNGDNWYLGDDTNGYLYTGGSNNLSVSTSSKTSWSISWNESQSAFRIQGNGRYLSCRSDLTSANKYLYRLGGETGSSGKSYFDIYKLTTGSIAYSEYCTTVFTTGTITLNAACNEGGIVYGTFCTNRAYVMHDNLVGSVVSVDNDGKLTVDEVYDGNKGDVVPANTALLISTADEFTGTKNYTITYTNEDGGDYSDFNMLKGTLTADEYTEGDGCLFYRLTMQNGTQIGFWWGAENGAAFKPGANKAYLAVPNEVAQTARGFAFGEETTGIAGFETMRNVRNEMFYNLKGQQVAQPTKGLYIVNGKKYIVK